MIRLYYCDRHIDNVTLDDLARMVADGFGKVGGRLNTVDGRLDKIEQILATTAATLVGVQKEVRELRTVLLTDHERHISKLEESVSQ